MKKLIKLSLFSLSMSAVGMATAGDLDVQMLNLQVEQKVEQVAQTGLLPTAIEIEAIMGDMVFAEVATTELTVEQAIERYQLTPTLERYIRIKQAQSDISALSNGGGAEPPFN